MAGLLDDPAFVDALGGPDTVKQLQAYLGLIGPQQSDLDKIDKDKWLNLGFGLLQGRKGDEFGAIGRAGMNALQTANQERTQLQAQRGQNLTQAMGLLQMAKAQQALQLKRQQMDENAAAFNGGQPQQGQAPAQPQGPPPVGALGGASSIPPPGTMPPPQQSAPPQAAAPSSGKADAYRQLAQIAAKYGDAESAKKYSDIANSLDAEYGAPTTVMVNGKPTLVMFDKHGNQKVLSGMSPAEKAVQIDQGGKIVAADPYTLNAIPGGAIYDKVQSPESVASNKLGYANLAETKRYHNLEMGMDENGQGTGNIDATAKAIANYQQPPLTSFAMSKPLGAAVMGKVMEINPNYDAKNYATAQQTANAFAKGQQGNTVRSIGVAMQHMDVLGQAADALNNGNVPVFNKIANAYATQTGGAAPTNFNAVKEIVSNEIVKAVVGSGGGVGDRDKAQKAVADANSPAQLKAVMDSYKQLFVGQLNGLEQQYKAGSQRDDFNKFLTPEVQALRANKAAASGKTVVRTGTDKNGNRVAQFSDGSIGPAP